MFLLDTNVVSEFRRKRPHGAVTAWLKTVSDDQLHVAAVTLGELQAGVERTRAHDPARAVELENWLEEVAETYNVLPMEGLAFRLWARLMQGRPGALSADAMIAATARVYSKIVVTRNMRDFRALGLDALNPFETPR